jgi:superfamily II DNA helicase RecQ
MPFHPGKDALAIMLTGGNRFVFNYQALLLSGINSNSPLIALMKDQVDRKSKRNKPVLSIVLKQKPNGNRTSIV